MMDKSHRIPLMAHAIFVMILLINHFISFSFIYCYFCIIQTSAKIFSPDSEDYVDAAITVEVQDLSSIRRTNFLGRTQALVSQFSRKYRVYKNDT